MKTAIDRTDAAPRGEAPSTAALHDLLRRIESEYREMPGMSVNEQQAQRLWGLDSTTCLFVLRTLIDRGILRRTARGTFIRCPPGSRAPCRTWPSTRQWR